MPKEKIKQLIRYNQLKALYLKYERVLMPATLVIGVIVDSITFTSINITTAFLLLGAYVVASGIIMLFMNAYDAGRLPQSVACIRYLRLGSPLLIQFFFGALLGASFIFYLFSGSLLVSWPFLLILVVLMVSNDVFRHYYERPVVQVGVYFFILFSLSAILLPFLFSTIGTLVFLFAGTVSILLVYGYIGLSGKVIPGFHQYRQDMTIAIFSIFACMNVFYFLNVIPPIPLSLREAIVAQRIERIGSGYQLEVETSPWYDRFIPGQTIHSAHGVVVYTAIFAPSNVNTTIVHQWYWYDEKKEEWIQRDRLPFTVTGGRREGFRGYSKKTHVEAGKWRVDVQTERGQVLGRVGLRVEEPTSEATWETITR